jgi:hypothetical protein
MAASQAVIAAWPLATSRKVIAESRRHTTMKFDALWNSDTLLTQLEWGQVSSVEYRVAQGVGNYRGVMQVRLGQKKVCRSSW